jgi:quercetin dioxygenase-like cupin family protein
MADQTLQVRNFYKEWVQAQGIPLIQEYYIEDAKKIELAWWEQKGGNGAILNLIGTGESNDAYVCEIPPGRSLKPERHIYEEMIFVLRGSGATTVWVEGSKKQTFEWQEGSLFAPPLNTWHELHNGRSDEPARFLAVTCAPLAMNLYHNLDFIFNNPFVFGDRYQATSDYFSGPGKIHSGRIWETNFIADVHSLEPPERKERGRGNREFLFELVDNTMAAHISEFAVGLYKKAHRHGPGAHVIILSGQGYSLMWPDGGKKLKFEWKPGTIIVPPEMWWHQHFNTGRDPARYLALRWGSQKYQFQLAQIDELLKDRREGGNQIEYEDEEPEIRQWFEDALKGSGVENLMT